MTGRVVPLPGVNEDAFNRDIAESLLTAAQVLARTVGERKRLGYTRIPIAFTDALCAVVDVINGGEAS